MKESWSPQRRLYSYGGIIKWLTPTLYVLAPLQEKRYEIKIKSHNHFSTSGAALGETIFPFHSLLFPSFLSFTSSSLPPSFPSYKRNKMCIKLNSVGLNLTSAAVFLWWLQYLKAARRWRFGFREEVSWSLTHTHTHSHKHRDTQTHTCAHTLKLLIHNFNLIINIMSIFELFSIYNNIRNVIIMIYDTHTHTHTHTQKK